MAYFSEALKLFTDFSNRYGRALICGAWLTHIVTKTTAVMQLVVIKKLLKSTKQLDILMTMPLL